VSFSDAFHDDVAVGDDSVQAIVITADRQRTDFEIAHQPCRDQQALALTNADVAGMHHVHGRGRRGSPKDQDPETGGRGECSIIVHRQTQTTDVRHERALREPCRRGGKGGQARIISRGG